MTFVFYRSVSDGWRIGITDSLEEAKVLVHDGASVETVLSSDIYIPELSNNNKNKLELLFNMSKNDSIFLQQKDAALMSPSPLIGVPPLIELLRYRTCNDEFSTNIGDNFSILIGEGNLLDFNPPGYDMALKSVFAYKGSHKRQVLVSCGHVKPNLFQNLIINSSLLFKATSLQLKIINAGINFLSAFTTTIGREQMCYMQAHLYTEGEINEKLKCVYLECDHIFTSGIGETNDFNFKIFSYLLYGFNGDEREGFFINRKQQDFICQSNIKDLNLIDNIREEYIKFTESAEILNIPFIDQLTLFSRIAAIIHLTEIEFYEDGSSSNLPALKNIAKILHLDFEQCIHIFNSREVCIIVARFLYQATINMILKQVNKTLNFNIENLTHLISPSITIISLPSISSEASDDLENIVISSIYEDLIQSFLRSSDLEVIQRQRAGFIISNELEAAFDLIDNYSLLKVLYGLGGILSIAQTIQETEQIKIALTSCAKHSKVKFNMNNFVLKIEHSFGTRQYQFPRNNEEFKKLKNIYHKDYTDLRNFLINNVDKNTLEAIQLLLEKENNNITDNIISEELNHIKRIQEILQDETNIFWWIGSIDLGADFRGDYIEKQIKEIPLPCAVQLRRYLPHRYITCRAKFINSSFGILLPSMKINNENNINEIAEKILKKSGVKYNYNIQDGFLLSGETLLELHLKVKERLNENMKIIQTFTRAQFSAYKLKRRVTAWTNAIQHIEKQRNKIMEEYHSRFENNCLNHSYLQKLMEEENIARSIIKEECWNERTELQQDVQEKLETTLVALVNSSIRSEDNKIRSTIRQKQTEKVKIIEEYIHERMNKHRAHLDSLIEDVLCGNQSQLHAEKVNKAHEFIIRGKEKEEERRKSLAISVERKRSKSELSRLKREKQIQEKIENDHLRHYRGKIVREEIQQAREDFNESLSVQMTLLDIENKMNRRVKEEVVSFRRQENERILQKLREERKKREETAIQIAKKNERKIIQNELRLQKRKEAEDRRKRLETQRKLDMQERQRRVSERLELTKKEQQKEVMRALLLAQSSIIKPKLYEHRAGQSIPRNRATDSSLSEPLILSNGKETYTRVLSASSLRGLVEFHNTKPRTKSPYPYATPKRY